LGAGTAADAQDRAAAARPPRAATKKRAVRAPVPKLPALARKASRKVPPTRKMESAVKQKARTAGAT
jgi:hypothetical protein